MNLPEAIKILSEHNRWRVGEIDAYMHKPADITKAIDLVLEAVKEKGGKPSCLGDDSGIYIPQKGDLFEWCDEKYWCIESSNYSGVVNPVGETFYQRGFIWNYGNEKPIFVRKATKQEFENMFGSL